MSNPKVFEFAKEIGMTPLALMEKIREWHLPVKSHMAELESEVLEQIKAKMEEEKSPKSDVKKAAVKKTAAKKTAVKKTEEAPAPAKPSVIVRKKVTKEEAHAEEAAPEVVTEKMEVAKETLAAKPVVKKKAAVVEEPVAEEPVVAQPEEVEVVQPQAPVKVQAKVEVTEPVKVEAVKEEPKVEAKAEAHKPTAVRKKEVVVGQSGSQSSQTPVSGPKRNIIGRMDLSRVSAPSGSQGGGFREQRQQGGGSGGYVPRAPGDRTQSSGGGGYSGGGGTGFGGGGAPRTGARNIRAGFIAQPTAPDIIDGDDSNRKSKFDERSKKVKTFTSVDKEKTEREAEEVVFNATEFRKREMVFQPKKKKGLLERVALKTQITTPKASKRILKVNKTMKLSDAAVEMGLKATELVKVLMKNGVMANMNTDLDFDTLSIIAPEFGWEAQNVFKTADEVIQVSAFGDLEAKPITRPPVVTIMGHVDHGKTSLLDTIRKTDVAAGEAGGITQHIGAYNVTLEDGRKVTFLDTPGHEAFSAMRARGANATDIAIIVVAADDGMMPQTAEAINHAKAAEVPIIIAINKIDKPGANPDRIKQQLTELQIVPEEWGGSNIFCEVSALKKTGIKELLEQILLVAEMEDLKANPNKSATGIVIESKMEKGRGTVVTLLVQDGTIKVGQDIVAGSVTGRVRGLMNDKGERIQEAGPGTPVEMIGLSGNPSAGDKFDIVKDEKTAAEVAGIRKEQAEKAASQPHAKMSLDELFSKVNQGDVKELPIILKTDVMGSLEALLGMFAKLTSAEVKTKIIHSAVGGITESDVLLASTSKGIIIGFNVRPDTNASALAKRNGIEIRTYSIVYELIDDMKKAMAGLLTPDVVEKVLGRVEVRNTFTVPKIGTIAGCFVVDGKIARSNMARLVRDGRVIYEGKISSLKRFKDDAKEVAQGFECGVGIENFNDIKVGDTIEAFVKEEIVRELQLTQ